MKFNLSKKGTENQNLYRTYLRNKNKIEESFAPLNEQRKAVGLPEIDTYKWFKQTFQETRETLSEYGKSTNFDDTMRSLGLTSTFSTASERFQQFATEGLDKWDLTGKLLDISGDQKIDPNKMEYQGDGTYKYGDVVIVFFDGSEKAPLIYKDKK